MIFFFFFKFENWQVICGCPYVRGKNVIVSICFLQSTSWMRREAEWEGRLNQNIFAWQMWFVFFCFFLKNLSNLTSLPSPPLQEELQSLKFPRVRRLWSQAARWSWLHLLPTPNQKDEIHWQPFLAVAFNKSLSKAHAYYWVLSELLFEGRSLYFFCWGGFCAEAV